MILRIIKIVPVCIFIFSSVQLAQAIRDIEIEGALNFNRSDYLEWISINPGIQIFEGIRDTLKNRILGSLADRGYLHSSIDSVNTEVSADSQNVDLWIYVTEGEPTYINSINFLNTDSTESAIVEPFFRYMNGSVFNKFEFEQNIIQTLDYFENNKFPFVSVKIASINFYTDTLSGEHLADINLEIEKGKEATISKVEIIGNTKTKDYVIIRNLRLQKDEPYSQERIEEIPKKLNRLRFFEPVPMPKYYYNSSDEGVLQINIKEKETNNFDGILGYVPGQGDDETGYFTGFVNISLRNIFGTERSAAIRWQQEDRFSQELELKYIEPWLIGYPFNLGLNLFQRKQDTSYVQRHIQGSLEFLATEEITASLLVASESTIPTENEFSTFTVYNSSILSTGINLNIDSRDDVYAPTEGILFNNSYKFSRKKINGPEEYITQQTETNINLQRLELDFSFFYELFFRQVGAIGLHAREMRGPFFEISDLYKLGGTNTLRGYREKQFLGNRIFWSNLEYRYLLTQRSFAFLFFDTGYYLRNEDDERQIARSESFKYGYGLGLSIETALGVLGVSYALGEGDSFSEGKIHFGILNEF